MKRCIEQYEKLQSLATLFAYKNPQLDKFNYTILYKNFLLSQINILSDIKLFIQPILYMITKMRKISAPLPVDLKSGLGFDEDLEYVYINDDGVVFQTIQLDACIYFMDTHHPCHIYSTNIFRLNNNIIA